VRDPAAVTHAAAATRLRAAVGVRAPDWLWGRGTAHHARARGLAGPAAQDPYRAGRGARAASARRPSARTRHPASPALHQHWSSRRGAGHGCRCAAPTTMRAQAVWLAQRHRIHAGHGAAPARPAPGDHPRAPATAHLRCGWLQGWMIRGSGRSKGKFSTEPLCFNIHFRIFTPKRHLPPFPCLPEPSLTTLHRRPTAALDAAYHPPGSQKLHQWEAHILLSQPV